MVFRTWTPGLQLVRTQSPGWLNVGVGAMATRLKQRGENIREHWQHLASKLQRQFGIRMPGDPTGYSYYVRGPLEVARIGDAFLTGDAAGLATRDLCEGIGPAIQSGQLASQAIVKGMDFALDGITSASLGGGLISRAFDWAFTHGASPVTH